MAIYKLPLDDDLDIDIINWIASFPRNKKSEVVRHALRYYMNESKEQEQVFIVNPVASKPDVTTVPVENTVQEVNITTAETPQENVEPQVEGKIQFGGQVPPKPVFKKSKKHSLLDDDNVSNEIPDINPDNLR